MAKANTGGRPGSGVEVRGDSIRVRFMWNGERCYETLPGAATPANLRAAELKAEEVKLQIRMGKFNYAEAFPNSPRNAATGADGKKMLTLRQMGDMWLASKGRLASNTRAQYTNALKFWYKLLDGERGIATFDHGELASTIGKYPWPSAKLINNYLVTLRGLFGTAWRDRRNTGLTDNPMDGIENSDLQKPEPDPFDVDEVNRILGDLREHYEPTIANYFEVAFATGLRPQEQIALKWADIDFEAGSARISRARAFRGEVKATKTYRARTVELIGGALDAVKRQKALTLLKPHGYVFENPVTGRPWHDERSQRDHYFYPALKRLGIRQRNQYCTRHTFASLAVMRGANVAWLAQQMGNSPRVLSAHYAKWINTDARRDEQRAILAAAFADIGKAA